MLTLSVFATTLEQWMDVLYTFIISMVPIIELRGAIPVGIGLGVPPWLAVTVSIIGNIIPVPFIIFFIKKIFAFMRRWKKLDGLVTRLEKRAEKKSDSIKKHAFWGLFLFVAIPLPGTGAWTGSLIAALLDMPPKKSLLTIALGVMGAAVIMTVASLLGFKAFGF